MASKYKGQLFVARSYSSINNGATRTYRMDRDLMPVLGQGSKIIFHGLVTYIDQNAEIDVRVTHGCLGDKPPSDHGFAVTMSGTTTINQSGTFTFETDDDLMADVEVEVDVYDSTATTDIRVEFELWATVIM